jgi:hypothetical protein
MGLYMKMIALGSIVLFGFVWMLAVVPGMAGSVWFQSLTPIEQYALYNLGVYVMLTGMVGGLISLALKGHLEPISMMIDGFVAFIIFSFVFDMTQAPFVLDSAGNFLFTSDGGTLAGTSVDYMTAWTWHSIGISGGALYFMTYVITPILAVIAAVLLFGMNRFLNLFSSGA